MLSTMTVILGWWLEGSGGGEGVSSLILPIDKQLMIWHGLDWQTKPAKAAEQNTSAGKLSLSSSLMLLYTASTENITTN